MAEQPKPAPKYEVNSSTPAVADVETAPVIAYDAAEYQTPSEIEETPSATEHAKTGYIEPEEEQAIPIEPEPDNEPSADLGAAMSEANAYAAATYGISIDGGLTMGNSSYFFPAMAPANATQDFVTCKATDIVDYTMQKILLMNRVSIDDPRLASLRMNVYVCMESGEIHCYCLYA